MKQLHVNNHFYMLTSTLFPFHDVDPNTSEVFNLLSKDGKHIYVYNTVFNEGKWWLAPSHVETEHHNEIIVQLCLTEDQFVKAFIYKNHALTVSTLFGLPANTIAYSVRGTADEWENLEYLAAQEFCGVRDGMKKNPIQMEEPDEEYAAYLRGYHRGAFHYTELIERIGYKQSLETPF